MIRCLAVDDEPLALELLADNIAQVPFLELVGTCRNAAQTLEALEKQEVDLLFLDIQMPGITGLQLLKTLSNPPMVILLTAYDQYALQSYELNVVDYLLKPVALERFVKAANKALDFHKLKESAQAPSTPENKAAYFFVNSEYSLVRIDYADIHYVEGLKDYVKIYLLSQRKPVLTRMSMKAMEAKLPTGDFLRVHRSFIIPLQKISSLRGNRIFIGDKEIPIGDVYKAALLKIIEGGSAGA